MSRSLSALAAIAAASVAGIWIHAATHGGPRRAPAQEPTALAETAGMIPAPAPDSKSSARPVAARAGARPPIASPDAEPEPATSTMANHRLAAAVRIAADPATGQLVAPEHSGLALTIEEMQDLARREVEGLITIRNPDGSETLNHEGRFTDYSVIRVGPDGRPVFQCVHGRSGVEHALRHAAPVTPNMEDR